MATGRPPIVPRPAMHASVASPLARVRWSFFS